MHSTSSMLRPPSISSSGLGLSPPSLSSIASKSSTWGRKNCNDHKTASKSFFSQVHLVNALSFQLFLPIPIHKLIHTTYPLLTSIAEPANDLLRYFGTKNCASRPYILRPCVELFPRQIKPIAETKCGRTEDSTSATISDATERRQNWAKRLLRQTLYLPSNLTLGDWEGEGSLSWVGSVLLLPLPVTYSIF